MNKVFITGASGFVGRHLCQYLLDKNISFRAGFRSQTSKSTSESSLAANPFESAFYGDLSQPLADSEWKEILKGCDAVVHLAARVHVMDPRHPSESYQKMNCEGTEKLAIACKHAGVKKFIFLSTIKVNGEATAEGIPFQADDKPKPEDAYAISKFDAELKLQKLHQPGIFEVVVIRPPLVYGPDTKGNFASLIKAVRYCLPMPFALVNNHRSLVSVFNLCDLILTCLQNPAAGGNVFLVSDGNDFSLKELLQSLAYIFRRPLILLPIPTKWLTTLGRILGCSDFISRLLGNLQVDIRKTRKTLNWRPPFNFEQTMLARIGKTNE